MNYESDSPNNASNGGDGSQRPPVNTEGVFNAPPPPPAYQYPPPRRESRGIFWMIGKMFGAVSVALLLIAIGYYGALATVLSGGGKVATELYRSGEGLEKIAIVPVEGLIGPDTASFVHDAVETALADDNVKAVVLWVDSGGGFVGPSEQIHHEIQRLKDKGLPVIASYGSVAASGGYYVSCHADQIFAQPVCVTGSIGVIASVMTFEDLLTEKLGITPLTMTASTSPEKDTANDLTRPWNEKDKAALQGTLDAMHDRFREVVKAGRVRDGYMSAQQFEAVTTGEAYMAEEAVANKLIDKVGFLSDAIDAARDKAGITAEQPPVVRYGVPQGLLGALGMAQQPDAKPLTQLDGKELRNLLIELGTPEAMFWHMPR